MEFLIITFIAVFITIIGALPFGLVNLSVLDVSYRRGIDSAMRISHGAAIVEVAFGLLAVTAGGLIAHIIRSSPVIYYLVLAVPAIAGVYFLLKGRYRQPEDAGNRQGFFRGMLLNLVSIQVLLYWLFAMTYLMAVREIDINVFTIVFFAAGIWLGKMGVLWLYAVFSKKIFCSMGFLARNINRVIGVVLLFTVVMQLVRQGL